MCLQQGCGKLRQARCYPARNSPRGLRKPARSVPHGGRAAGLRKRSRRPTATGGQREGVGSQRRNRKAQQQASQHRLRAEDRHAGCSFWQERSESSRLESSQRAGGRSASHSPGPASGPDLLSHRTMSLSLAHPVQSARPSSSSQSAPAPSQGSRRPEQLSGWSSRSPAGPHARGGSGFWRRGCCSPVPARGL